MKRFLLLQLALLMLLTSLLCVPVNAAKATDGKFYYELSSDGKYYSIVDSKSTLRGHVDIPKEYKGIPVKVIGHNAFYDRDEITSVTVYKNINTIESTAFRFCDNLSKIVLSDHIKYIDSTAFDDTEYYDNEQNWSLDVLYIGKHLIKADKSIAGNYRIKNGTETIASSAFEECSALTAVVIPNTVHSIPDYAFKGCGKLNHIYLPEGITSIGVEAFASCGKVDCMTIPSTVTYIGECALPYMDALYIPASVTMFGPWAAYNIGTIYGVKGSKAEKMASDNSEFVDISTHSHTYETVEYSVASENTCGIKYKKCSECGLISSYKVTNQLLPGATKLKSITSYHGRSKGIYITWNAVSGADQYRVYRKANGDKSWTHIANATYIDYCDGSIKNNTMYTYTVRAQNEAGLGAYNKTGLKYKCIYAPEIKSVTNTDEGVKITWGKVAGADKYYIFRLDEVSREWKCIKKLTDTTLVSYLDTTTKLGVRYYYKLRSSSGTYKSSDTDVDTPKDVTVYMKSPKLISAKSTKNGVRVEWGKTAGADSYIIYRKTGSGSWVRLAVVNSGSTVFYLDKTAKKGTTYTYTVKASSCGYFTSSYNKTGLKIKYITAPVLTKISNEADGVRVYWNKVSEADGYYVYRRVTGTTAWTRIATIKKNSTTSYKDKTAVSGQRYDYTVKAYDGKMASGCHSLLRAYRLTTPSLKSIKKQSTGVTVTWSEVKNADGYYVYRKNGNSTWERIGVVNEPKIFKFTDNTIEKGKTYSYTVRAFKGNDRSYYNTKGLTIKL